MKTYLVGGAVRDKLLNNPVKDRDWVVVGSSPQELLDLGYQQVGKDFPVFLHPETHEEYALARTERSTGPGYHGFETNTSQAVTLEEDLMRRDLTINALAEDENGNIIDPFGGQKDLSQRLLRHVSTAFIEDPVRVLRIARFAAQLAAKEFRVADETQALMQNMVSSGEIDALVAERVWQELHRALMCEQPRRFFEVLQGCGALEVLFPELERLFGVPQKAEWHPEIDTGIHTLMVLDQACKLSDDPTVRFAAICHDFGKGLTPAELLPAHHGHEELSAKLTAELCDRLAAPKRFRDLAVMVARYHTVCHRVFELKPSTLLKKILAMDGIRRPERFAAYTTTCEADARGRLGLENQPYLQADYFRGALAELQSLDISAIVKTCEDNKKIALKIQEARIKQLRDYKARYPMPELT